MLKDLIPDYAKDLRLNLSGIERSEFLSPEQLYGTMLAVAVGARSPRLLTEVETLVQDKLSVEVQTAARAAAALMGMNNIYYRFLHLSSNANYQKMPPRLRMQGLATHGMPTVDFELWCLAVSAVNGCGLCVDSHEQKLRAEGAREEAIQDVVRIAAVLHGIATVADALPATASA